jgi:two-component system, cell cycle sensor histidine kinase and response regulator CckA
VSGQFDAGSKVTGLGLATVYGIVTQSGGHVWAYSEERRGTVFKVFLPLTDLTPQPPRPAAAVERRRGTELVLLVEDDNLVRQLSRRVLEGAGYRFIEAATPEAAERAFTPDIDALVTDVIMPGSSGPDLFRTLAAIKPALKVLFTSGYTVDMITRQGRLPPDMTFLQKPFTPDALCQKLRKVLDG